MRGTDELQVRELNRVFKHGKNTLPDPDPAMSPESVMQFYSMQYPELTTSNLHGPKVEDDALVYEFKTVVGTKG
ncbi:MAG: PRTRC system protein C [Tannerellaceae bacterium]